MKQGDLPKARVAHSCSFDPVGGDIYLWGGFTGELSRLADFYVYNCKTSCWRRLVMEGGDASPPARAFHSAVFHDGALYLFSGANGDIRYNDVWRYQVRRRIERPCLLLSRMLVVVVEERGQLCLLSVGSKDTSGRVSVAHLCTCIVGVVGRCPPERRKLSLFSRGFK